MHVQRAVKEGHGYLCYTRTTHKNELDESTDRLVGVDGRLDLVMGRKS